MEATVVMIKCSKTKKSFGARIEKKSDGDWYRTWAFPIDEHEAATEGYDKTQIKSFLPVTEEYPGCPHCGTHQFTYCHACNKLTCWNGEDYVTCQWCGNSSRVEIAKDKFDVSGRGY